jgi:hypothetical protein
LVGPCLPRTGARRVVIRRKLCLTIMAITSALVFSGPASAQDLNCDDFDSQAEAQDFLREDPSDPEGLDGPPGNASTGIRGVACEDNPPPTDFDPALSSGVGVPNGVPEEDEEEPPDRELPEEDPPDGEPPERKPPDRALPDREPPDEDKELLNAGGDLPLPPQSDTDNDFRDDSRFPLWRVAGMILSAVVFVWASHRVISRW